jgi:hypothetical protein
VLRKCTFDAEEDVIAFMRALRGWSEEERNPPLFLRAQQLWAEVVQHCLSGRDRLQGHNNSQTERLDWQKYAHRPPGGSVSPQVRKLDSVCRLLHGRRKEFLFHFVVINAYFNSLVIDDDDDDDDDDDGIRR